MIFRLAEQHVFPNPEMAEPDGLLAVGGDLNADRVLMAYKQGIFPWYSDDEPLMWWSPNPRFVILPSTFKVSKSMRPVIRKYNYTVTINKAFEAVIANCKLVYRKDQEADSWITEEMQQTYIQLNNLGHTISVEFWNEKEELAGGLYGLLLGTMFCGESMFAKQSNASKIAFTHFANFLFSNGCKIIDCQTYTNHLESFGGSNLSRPLFLKMLEKCQTEVMNFTNINEAFTIHFEKLRAEKSVFF